ncbi:MAG: hypothetical protein IT314_15575 [Anaerolineales bacterium]|nr:hypothetical protein [Anaerolineales bacterium]
MAKKIDGVVEAVRYKNGQIAMVRAFERRGSSFSDRVLIERKGLMERIKGGKKFVTGSRRELWASTFETGKALHVVNRNGKEFIVTHDEAERDELAPAPVF